MIEKDIEDRIISQLGAALGQLPHQSTGLWALEPFEEDGSPLMAVRVQPRGYEIETAPCAVFQAAVTLIVRREEDVDALAYISAVQARLELWQMDYEAAAAALGGTGFSLAGFTMTGGTLEQDSGRSAWIWEQPLTIRGTISTTTNQE